MFKCPEKGPGTAALAIQSQRCLVAMWFPGHWTAQEYVEDKTRFTPPTVGHLQCPSCWVQGASLSSNQWVWGYKDVGFEGQGYSSVGRVCAWHAHIPGLPGIA